ncbi:hypothetical protein ACSQ67_014995 [Phaseolus vulgaris]
MFGSNPTLLLVVTFPFIPRKNPECKNYFRNRKQQTIDDIGICNRKPVLKGRMQAVHALALCTFMITSLETQILSNGKCWIEGALTK